MNNNNNESDTLFTIIRIVEIEIVPTKSEQADTTYDHGDNNIIDSHNDLPYCFRRLTLQKGNNVFDDVIE